MKNLLGERMYKVEINRCNCHPETCACNDYKVVDENGKKVSSHFHRDDAENLCNVVNGTIGELDFQKRKTEQLAHQVRAQKAAKTKLKNRIKHGVCPCCKRTFQNIAKHIATKHPGYGK